MDVAVTFATVLAPVVLALVQMVKTSFPIPKNIVPVLGLLLGILVGCLAYPFTDLDIAVRIWAGALAGLSSVGLFEAFNTRTGTTIEKSMIVTSEPLRLFDSVGEQGINNPKLEDYDFETHTKV